MSTILVNTLTGTSTAGSIAVTGEGNSTTTNLQNGLAKAWVNFDGSGTIATRDSFNVSSLNDDGTGKYDVVITNNMTNNDYAVSAGGAYDTSDSSADTMPSSRRIDLSTSEFGIRSGLGSFVDSSFVFANIHGDLA